MEWNIICTGATCLTRVHATLKPSITLGSVESPVKVSAGLLLDQCSDVGATCQMQEVEQFPCHN